MYTYKRTHDKCMYARGAHRMMETKRATPPTVSIGSIHSVLESAKKGLESRAFLRCVGAPKRCCQRAVCIHGRMRSPSAGQVAPSPCKIEGRARTRDGAGHRSCAALRRRDRRNVRMYSACRRPGLWEQSGLWRWGGCCGRCQCVRRNRPAMESR